MCYYTHKTTFVRMGDVGNRKQPETLTLSGKCFQSSFSTTNGDTYTAILTETDCASWCKSDRVDLARCEMADNAIRYDGVKLLKKSRNLLFDEYRSG